MIAFFQAIIEFVQSLAPLVTVMPDERAAIVRFGKVKREVGPGLYWRLPIVDQIVSVSCATDYAESATQTLTTRDYKSFSVGGRVEFSIVEASKAQYKVYEIKESLVDVIQSAIQTEIMSHTFTELIDNRTSIAQDIFQAIEGKVTPWGIALEEFSFSNYCRTPAVRILQE